jgi:hypothetical protein
VVLIKGEPRRGLISDDDTSDKLKVGLVFQVRLWLCVVFYDGYVCLLCCTLASRHADPGDELKVGLVFQVRFSE